MINEQRINELTDKLEYAAKLLSSNSKPSKEWLRDINWLIYDTRRDLERQDFGFNGLFTAEQICRGDYLRN